MLKKNSKCNHENERETRRIGRLGEKGTYKMKICDYCKKKLNQWIKHLFIYI